MVMVSSVLAIHLAG